LIELDEAFEIKFATPSQMQRRTEELRAAIQTPQFGEHQSYQPNDVTTLPVVYPKSWKETLRDRGFI